MNPKHIILGAGAVGASTAQHLSRAGITPIMISRHTPATLPPGVLHRSGDVLDRRFMREVCDDATTLYQCLNAPYHRWERFPPLQFAAIEAARHANARYISFENVYMYGRPGPTPFDEDSPHAPCSNKGVIRAKMAQALDALRAQGELEVVQVRAGTMFGPAVRASVLGDEVFGRIAQGLKPRIFGDPHQAHSWTYVHDAGAAMAACGLASAPPPLLHVPNDSPRTYAELLASIEACLGQPLSYAMTPTWLLRILGLFKPEAGALVEMIYEFERPFIITSKHAQGLGLRPTPTSIALRHTLDAFAIKTAPIARLT